MATVTFAKNVAGTMSARVASGFLMLLTTVIIARVLGPEGKGIYSLAILLPALIIIFAQLGIGPATTYHTAQGHHSRRDILGSNIWISLVIGTGSVIAGLFMVLYLAESVFPGVPRAYALVALSLIPVTLLSDNIQQVLLGLQRFRGYNLAPVLRGMLSLALVCTALWLFNAGIPGAIFAGSISFFISAGGLFFFVRRAVGGVSWRPNRTYISAAIAYGAQIQLGNVVVFLAYRIDLLLVNWFLNPLAVGFYAIAVEMAERLWMVSAAASTVLYPHVAAETDEKARKAFTPVVSRNVFWFTSLGASIVFGLSHWIVVALYSSEFLPAVRALQILLPGVVVLGVASVLAHDISGRGRPLLNLYPVMLNLGVNISLNLILIPRYGIEGAAWATTISYATQMFSSVAIYWRLTGNGPLTVLVPQHSDWEMWRRLGLALVRRATGTAKLGVSARFR